MTYSSTVQLGRPISACLTTDISFDKWDILNALTQAAEQYNVTHRTLSVLRALMTFLPEREIKHTAKSAIVFPSNKTLSHRLGGMPESTLRRHLSKLVNLGIVSRYDSPNRKRFARRVGGTIKLSFGFDLSPLGANAVNIFSVANEAKLSEERKQALKAHILHLRTKLHEQGPADENEALMAISRLILRRKASEEELLTVVDALETKFNHVKKPKEAALKTVEISASNIQNERHIYSKEDLNSDSEQKPERVQKKESDLEQVSLDKILIQFTEYKTLYPEPINSWNELTEIAQKLVPMIGIEPIVFHDAQKKMGAGQAEICILYILEKLGKITNPGGYLRKLANDAAKGTFNVSSIIAG